MRSAQAILVVTPALLLAGCVVGSKQHTAKNLPPPPQPVPKAAPAPPAGPLSIPQTQVELPPPQPVDPDALAAAQSTQEQISLPSAPPRNTSGRRRGTTGPPPIAAPKTEPEPAAPAAPAAAPTPAESGTRIQEILPAGEQRRLQDQADARKREIRQLLEQAGARRLTRSETTRKKTIESYLKLSDQAEASGDMRQASEIAERAWILAKDLQGVR